MIGKDKLIVPMRHRHLCLFGQALMVVRDEGVKKVCLLFFKKVKVLLLKLFTPVIICFLPKTFVYDGVSLNYCYRWNLLSWRNSRAMEVPIINYYREKSIGGRELEVGRVMPHYQKGKHFVIDKYESGDHNTKNVDILEYKVLIPVFSLVFSVCTFEHIGIDDEDLPHKTVLGLHHVKNHLLVEGGVFIITFPLGYNEVLDDYHKTFFDEIHYMQQIRGNEWIQILEKQIVPEKKTVAICKYCRKNEQ